MMESTAVLPINRVARFVRSRGWLSQVVAGLVLIALIAGIAANQFFSNRFGVDGTASDYVTALGRGDAEGAWALMVVYDRALPGSGTSLLSLADLKAQMKLPENQIHATGVRVSNHQDFGDQAAVTVNYTDGAWSRSMSLVLARDQTKKHYLVYPVWRVVVHSALLELALPAAAGPLTVDGLRVPGTPKNLSVFPGVHEVGTQASAVLEASVAKVTASPTADTPTRVTSAPRLAAGVEAKGRALIANAFAACPQDTVLDGCAKTLDPRTTFKLIGDPAADAKVTVTSAGDVQATGSYRMLTSRPSSDPTRPTQDVINGTFLARFKANAGGLDGVALTRPAEASDAALRSAVGAAIQACALATVESPNGCPQAHRSLGTVVSLKWTLVGDPIANSTITYNDGLGIFYVRGRYEMTATYKEIVLGSTIQGDKNDSGNYMALVVWDAGTARVVRID